MASVPIASLDTERSVLATAIIYQDAAAIVLDPAILHATDFDNVTYAQVYTVLRTCHSRKQHGLAAALDEAQLRGWTDARALILTDLTGALAFVPESADVAVWIQALQTRRNLRRKADMQQRAIQAIMDDDMDRARELIAKDAPATEYEVAPPLPITAPDLGRKTIEPTRYFIPDVLRAGLALYIGNPGIGKTPALLQLALAFAFGGRWLGALQCRKSRVLYLGIEYDEAYIKEVLLDSVGSADLPPDLHILSLETFTSPATAEESIQLLDYYLRVMGIEVIIPDTFSGYLPREKFKQNAYRGDYAEFLEYHRLLMSYKALLVGAWHGGKHNKDPETAYNGGQGMWGSAGGGRLTMFFDDDQQVRIRSQLRGHERMEWLLEQARVGDAHFWSVVDADPDPILSSVSQRRIFSAVKHNGTPAEPITPAGVRAVLRADNPEEVPVDHYIRQTLGRMVERGFISKIGGGYILKKRGSGGSGDVSGSGGSGGSDSCQSQAVSIVDRMKVVADVNSPIQGGSLFEGRWIAPEGFSDAANAPTIQAIHDIERSTDPQGDPPIYTNGSGPIPSRQQATDLAYDDRQVELTHRYIDNGQWEKASHTIGAMRNAERRKEMGRILLAAQQGATP